MALAQGRTKRVRENLEGYLYISPWLIGLILFQVGPMILSLIISLYDWDYFRSPNFVGMSNYIGLFKDDLFWLALRNTATYVAGRLLLVTTVSLFVAILLNQPIPLRNFLRTAYYLPSVTPSIAMLMLWIMLFDPQWGLINAGLAGIGVSPGPGWLSSKQWAMPAMILIGIWGIGGTMVIFLAGLQGVPKSLYEAAELDGANALRKMMHITLPLISPVIFFNVIMGVIRAFQVFASAFVMTDGGPAYATFVYVLYLYNQAFLYFRMGVGCAMAWILLLILLVFTYIMFKRSTWVYYEAG